LTSTHRAQVVPAALAELAACTVHSSLYGDIVTDLEVSLVALREGGDGASSLVAEDHGRLADEGTVGGMDVVVDW
jgi:hypothetical protein